MNKFVDNLLGKIDQLKRKVMTAKEENDAQAEELPNSSDSIEKMDEAHEKSGAVVARKNVGKPGRPRRKSTKAKTRAAETSVPEKKEQRPQKQLKKSSDTQPPKNIKKEEKEPVIKLLINAEEPEECRIALIEDGRVESFHVTTVVHEQTKGNIYKGRVSAIEPNLQAAFVDIGTGKNGFLPFSEIHPEYYTCEKAAAKALEGSEYPGGHQKGPGNTCAGCQRGFRHQGSQRHNLSFSAGTFSGTDARQRQPWHFQKDRRRGGKGQAAHHDELFKYTGWDRLHCQDGQQGYYQDCTEQGPALSAAGYGVRQKNAARQLSSPALIYKDQDIIAKVLRDYYSPDIQEILVDTKEAQKQVMDFLKLLPTKQRKTTVRLHQGSRPIFNQYAVEEQIEQIYQPVVKLPSGGSIVISPTEALVAIDVNSGRTAKDKNFDETIFLANMEAAAELARQLRLRDLGGLIVVDFIDMRNARHIREVEKQVKTSMKRDRAKVDISRISRFGLMQISRQKLGRPIEMGSYHVCEYCQGRGVTRSVETQSLSYLRRIQTGIAHKNVVGVTCRLPVKVAQYLLNNKREELLEMEKQLRRAVSESNQRRK